MLRIEKHCITEQSDSSSEPYLGGGWGQEPLPNEIMLFPPWATWAIVVMILIKIIMIYFDNDHVNNGDHDDYGDVMWLKTRTAATSCMHVIDMATMIIMVIMIMMMTMMMIMIMVTMIIMVPRWLWWQPPPVCIRLIGFEFLLRRIYRIRCRGDYDDVHTIMMMIIVVMMLFMIIMMMVRERCKKKKEKKLTSVSFMYVCVTGNGEMLVFFSPFFPQQ